MTDKPIPDRDLDDDFEEGPETLIVPPPNYQERLQAAQRARANEARKAVEIPNPLTKPETPSEAESPQPEQKSNEPERGKTEL